MLLRYLKQARDADKHSIQDFTKIEAGSRGIRFVNPSGGYIKHMEIRGGDIVTYEGDPIIHGSLANARLLVKKQLLPVNHLCSTFEHNMLLFPVKVAGFSEYLTEPVDILYLRRTPGSTFKQMPHDQFALVTFICRYLFSPVGEFMLCVYVHWLYDKLSCQNPGYLLQKYLAVQRLHHEIYCA